jgi:predicted dehydrogenase
MTTAASSPSDSPLKVAVIGASGIGKNHARWFHQHGCDVAAFVGSSPDSVAKTQKVLEQGFGFAGRGYADAAEMLRAERPDAVCVSSPPALHYDQVMQCLKAGAHVLCEKPLVGDDTKPDVEVIEQARQLVDHAIRSGRLLGTQMQYAVAVSSILELSGIATNDTPTEPVREWMMEMETKNVRPGRSHQNIWIDLSPHPLSVLQKVAGGAEINWDTVECTVREMETDARFRLHFPGKQGICTARIVVRCNPERDVPLRRFTINGRTVDYTARKNERGEFHAFLTASDGRTIELPDFVDTLIGNFVAACRGDEPLTVTGADGAQNVEWQLRILAASRKDAETQRLG